MHLLKQDFSTKVGASATLRMHLDVHRSYASIEYALSGISDDCLYDCLYDCLRDCSEDFFDSLRDHIKLNMAVRYTLITFLSVNMQ